LRKMTGDVINTGSLVLLIFLAIMEVEAFTFGGPLIRTAGRDAWLSILLGSLLTYPLVFLVVRLAQRFPRTTFFEYTPRVWGKFLGIPIILFMVGYWMLWLVKLLWRVGDINTSFFLPNTPLIVSLFFFVLGAVYLAKYGLVPIVRFFEFMFFFYFISYFPFMLIILLNGQIEYLYPFLEGGIWPVIKGALIYLGMLQGPEVLLFAIPLTLNPSKALLPSLAGLTLFHFAAFLQMAAVLVNLGISSASDLVYPSMDMLSTLHLPGWPVERFELFLTFPWLIGTFTSTALAIYLASNGLMSLLPWPKPPLIFWAVGILVIPPVYLIPNILWTEQMESMIWLITPLAIYLLPLATFGLAVLRKKRGEGT